MATVAAVVALLTIAGLALYISQRHSAPRRFRLSLPQQLRTVGAASFEKKRLLNYSEYKIFKIIEKEVATLGRYYRVFPQTSLGEVLRTPDNNAFFSINDRRVDMLIVDGAGWPVAAIEYQGGGHYKDRARAIVRDEIKREALVSAGIEYFEVFEDESETEIRARLRGLLGSAKAAAE